MTWHICKGCGEDIRSCICTHGQNKLKKRAKRFNKLRPMSAQALTKIYK